MAGLTGLAVLLCVLTGALWWRVRQHRPALESAAALALLGAIALPVTLIHQENRQPESLRQAEGTPGRDAVVVTERTITAQNGSVPVRIVWFHGDETASIPASLMSPTLTERIAPGTTLRVRGTVVAETAFRPRAWRIFAESVEVLTPAPWLQQVTDSMREEFLAASLSRGGDGGALLPGLALGDTEAVSPGLENDMRRSSLAHLVAVSGANCALVVALAVGVTAVCGGGLRARLVVGVLALAGFVVLVTPEPSVIRAAVMASIALVALVMGRPAQGLSVLGATAWLLLLLDPWRSVEFAFILSVAATAGIIAGLAPLARALSGVVPTAIAWIVALPVAAQLAAWPIMILLRPTLPSYGIIANLLATPLAPFVTAAGLFGALSSVWWPAAGHVAAWLGWWPASAIAAIAQATAQAPLAELPWPPGALGAVLAGLVSAFLFGSLGRWRPRALRVSAGILVVLGLASASGSDLVSRLERPADWQIAQCDVGQGDALLVNTAAGIVAIDTGDDEEALRSCLRVLGVHRVALLVLSHFDIDHMGQADVYRGRVEMVLTGPPDNDSDRQLIASLRDAGAIVHQVVEGDWFDLGDHELIVHWPTSKALHLPGNDSSVVVQLRPYSANPLSLLALGDVGEMPQRMLLSRLMGTEVDVVKVSHHGSADQYPGLYQQLKPLAALIGVGADNDYGHPTDRALDTLGAIRSAVVRSDQSGTATLHRNEAGEVELWSERAG